MNEQQQQDSQICARLRANDPSLDRLKLLEPRVVHCSPTFQDFIAALRENQSVHTVFVGELVIQMTEEDKICQLLEALGELQSLEALEMALPHINEQKKITGQALARFLCLARKLKTLVLWPYVLFANEQEVSSVAHALLEHPNLQQLAWMNVLLAGGGGGNDLSIDVLLGSLATVPCLESLQLASGLQVQGQKRSIREAETLSHLIKSTTRLQSLSLRNFGLTNDDCMRLAQALTEQPGKLKTLDLRFNSISDPGYEALRTMLDENFVLEWLETDLMNAEGQELLKLKKNINFSLLLNRAGRFTLLKDAKATRDQRLQVLSKTEDNLDASYYLLRCSPSLCDRPLK